MGVGAGVIRMKNVPVKTTDSADIEKQESDLAEAYAQSAEHDKKIAAEFDATVSDGLLSVQKTQKGSVACKSRPDTQPVAQLLFLGVS